ncbi:hypothetical protein D9M68_441730 [compost metagenome]
MARSSGSGVLAIWGPTFLSDTKQKPPKLLEFRGLLLVPISVPEMGFNGDFGGVGLLHPPAKSPLEPRMNYFW